MFFNLPTSYDVIIIGAGPAGSQCARRLSEMGKKVLLVEKESDYSRKNFSSAGSPIDVMQQFDLPSHVVGAYWKDLDVRSTNAHVHWESNVSKGVVFDFKELRAFLAGETKRNGSDVALGCSFASYFEESSQVKVTLKDEQSQALRVFHTKVLVDATGTERAVLLGEQKMRGEVLAASGMEYIVAVDPKTYKKFSTSLSFFLGKKWMPQGYGWVFPMTPCNLKVGVARYFIDQVYVPHSTSFKTYIEKLMEETFQTQHLPILERHGKTIRYSMGQKDPRISDRVLAIGDAISCLNPLGGEGIRHGMESGTVAAKHIDWFIDRIVPSLAGFQKEMESYFGWRWKVSEWFTRLFYCQKKDRNVDKLIESLHSLSYSQATELLFRYDLSLASQVYLRYLLKKLGL